MQPKPIPVEKRHSIIDRKYDSFRTFWDSLPHEGQKLILRHRRPVPGFQPRGKNGNEEKLKVLFQDLRKRDGSKDSERAWYDYNNMIQLWVTDHEELNTVLLEFDNSSDFVEDKNGVPPNTEVDVECFALLARASAEGRVSRELIQTFYDYGYFLPDSRIEQFISLAKTEEEVKKIRKVKALPEEVEALKASCEDLKDIAERLSSRQSENHERLNQLSASFTNQQATMQQGLESITQRLSMKVDIEQLDDLETRLMRIDEVSAAVLRAEESMLSATSNLRTEQVALADRITQIDNALMTIQQQLDDLREAVAPIQAPLGDQTQRIANGNQPEVPEEPPSHWGALPILALSQVLAPSFDPWSAGDEIVTCLQNNLCSIGLAEGSANMLTREILAGLAVGQLLIFRGSLAATVARVSAQALAATLTYTVRVPTALLSPDALGRCLETLATIAERSDTLVAAIVGGANRAAFEVYGDDLRTLVTERLLGLPTRPCNLLLMATTVEGPAALPLPPSLCDLGPVLDIDALVWRSNSSPPLLDPCSVPYDAWRAQVTPEVTGVPIPQSQDLRRIAGQSGVQWHRCIAAAYTRLIMLTPERKEDGALHSLLASWVVPFAIAQGETRKQIRDRIEAYGQETGHELLNDARLQRILRLPQETQAE